MNSTARWIFTYSKPANPGAIYGVIELLAERGFSDELMSISECEFYIIEHSKFVELLRNDPEICFELATMYADIWMTLLGAVKSGQ